MNRVGRSSARRWAGIGMTTVIVCLGFTREAWTEPAHQLFRSPEAAFAYLHAVATHQRCVNCHGTDHAGQRVPTVGDTMALHPMNITERHNPRKQCPTPEERNRLAPLGAIKCTSCHGVENSREPGGPPGAWDAHLEWQMPTRDITRLQRGMSKQALCRNWHAAIQERVKQAEQCPGKKLSASELFTAHIAEDGLIAWAFDPGPGRTPAPGSLERLKAAARIWAPMLESDTWCHTLEKDRRP